MRIHCRLLLILGVSLSNFLHAGILDGARSNPSEVVLFNEKGAVGMGYRWPSPDEDWVVTLAHHLEDSNSGKLEIVLADGTRAVSRGVQLPKSLRGKDPKSASAENDIAIVEFDRGTLRRAKPTGFVVKELADKLGKPGQPILLTGSPVHDERRRLSGLVRGCSEVCSGGKAALACEQVKLDEPTSEINAFLAEASRKVWGNSLPIDGDSHLAGTVIVISSGYSYGWGHYRSYSSVVIVQQVVVYQPVVYYVQPAPQVVHHYYHPAPAPQVCHRQHVDDTPHRSEPSHYSPAHSSHGSHTSMAAYTPPVDNTPKIPPRQAYVGVYEYGQTKGVASLSSDADHSVATDGAALVQDRRGAEQVVATRLPKSSIVTENAERYVAHFDGAKDYQSPQRFVASRSQRNAAALAVAQREQRENGENPALTAANDKLAKAP